jgi:nucleotide-binding universal stress UspA family protein
MSTGSVGPAVYESIREALRQEAEKKVDHAVDSLEDLSVSRAILEGPIPASIVEESRRSSLDLLVVGSRRFGPLRRLLLGSVSRALMHSAPCSLVVVPRGGG